MAEGFSESVEIINGNKNEFVHPLYHQNKPYFLTSRADFAKQLMQNAVIAACPAERLDAYQAFDTMAVAEVVQRACDVADAAYTAFEQRGWILPIPTRSESMRMLQNGDTKGAGFTQ